MTHLSSGRALVGLAALIVATGFAVTRARDDTPIARTVAADVTIMAMDARIGRVLVVAGNTVRLLSAGTGALLRTTTIKGHIFLGAEVGGPASVVALDRVAHYSLITAFDMRNGTVSRGYVDVVDSRDGHLVRAITASLIPVVFTVHEHTGHAFIFAGTVTPPYSRGSVIVLDVRHGTVLRVISADTSFGGMVVDDRRGRVVVGTQRTDANGNPVGAGAVRIFDATSGRPLRVVRIGQEPRMMALDSSNGRIFAVTRSHPSTDEDSVTALNAHTGMSYGTVVVGSSPIALVVDEQTQRLFAIVAATQSPYGGTVCVIDAASGRLLHTVALHDTPLTAVVDTHNHHVFVVAQRRDANGNYTAGGSVSMLDASNGRILHTLTIGNYPTAVAIDALHARVFVAAEGPIDANLQDIPLGAGNVTVLDANSGSALQTVRVGVAPLDLVVDERTRHVFVLNGGGTVEDRTPFSIGDRVLAWLHQRLRAFPSPTRTRFHAVASSVMVFDEPR